MELRHLRYFVAVAEELHFTRAAERLHIGQPPLSQQIQALEQEVGARLLDRSRRWVRLTEAGKLFLQDARRILALAEAATDTARRAERGEIGELRIGFTPSTLFMPLFPSVINAYRKQFPNVTLTLKEMVTMRQIDAMDQRQLDIGFIRPPAAEIPRGISLTTLQHDPLTLVAPVNHRLARKATITISDLAEEAFVMFLQDVGTGTYPQILRLCREAGFSPKIAMEAREPSIIIGLVAAGCGISILPESFKCIRIKGVCYRPISGASAVMQLMLASRNDAATPLVTAFQKLAMAFGH
ncbi:LysR substrate-binding domain-containing protein [Janthinobacterium sp. 17J80-10]|uniref:LysR substrate-binding domain-containing protein n=1 Tax=Janthinobacterium sp. 17J80-10 TaxID=2497863 RepID=UPI0010053D5F|nr:LysR substrate-binding domain-containing protein [Janthinobacterium sp. 17J80-10]QAU33211.1 LysR family transcriptional regulator [Janthinobacterium sp. 17J80-10]